MALKYARRLGDWLGSWPVFRNTLTLAIVSLACGELAYSAAWRTAQKELAAPTLVARNRRLTSAQSKVFADIESQFVRMTNGQAIEKTASR